MMEALRDEGVSARMMEGLPFEASTPKTVRIDATHLKAHRTTARFLSKKGGTDDQGGSLVDRIKGGMNIKLHSVTGSDLRPTQLFMTAGGVGGSTGAAAWQKWSRC